VALAVLADPIGQIPQTPGLALLHVATLVFDDGGEGVRQGVDLSGRQILTRNEHVLVERH